MMNRLWIKIALCVLALTFFGSTAFAAETKSVEKGSAPGKKSASKEGVTGSESKPVDAATKPVDINSATKDQLMITLGVDEGYAKKIIEGRPYQIKTQLRSRGILPPEIFYDIKDRIVVKIDDKQQKSKAKK
jgi:DNA uptake protein ComE-like DNA-binding protein